MSRKATPTLIVVVDDDAPIRVLLCQLLQGKGYRVVGCASGKEAIEEIRRLRPQAVTLDIEMPEMDGTEVLERLSSDEETAAVPVVVVSAYPSARRLRSHRQVASVVLKPFDADKLLSEVHKAVIGQVKIA